MTGPSSVRVDRAKRADLPFIELGDGDDPIQTEQLAIAPSGELGVVIERKASVGYVDAASESRRLFSDS